MQVFLISGNGTSAGKTTLAEKLVGPVNVYSIATPLRIELAKKYPNYNWFSKDQTYKENTQVREHGPTDTIRSILIQEGNRISDEDPSYWARALFAQLDYLRYITGITRIAIDDVRRIEELNYLKEKFPQAHHWHVTSKSARPEPKFEDDACHFVCVADYVINR